MVEDADDELARRLAIAYGWVMRVTHGPRGPELVRLCSEHAYDARTRRLFGIERAGA